MKITIYEFSTSVDSDATFNFRKTIFLFKICVPKNN